MSRRIDIEITSLQGDVATWRAAGAKLPKGVLPTSLVPGGPVVGGVYRADVEQYMEGIEVLSVAAPKTASPVDPRNERLELIPTPTKGPDVVVTYAAKGRGPRRDSDRHEGGRESYKRPGSRTPAKDRATGPHRAGAATRARAAHGEARASGASRGAGRAAHGSRPAPDDHHAPQRPAGDPLTRAVAGRRAAAARRDARGANRGGRTEQERDRPGTSHRGSRDHRSHRRGVARAHDPRPVEGPGVGCPRRGPGVAAARPARRRHLRQDGVARRGLAPSAEGTPGCPDGPPGDAAHAVEREARQGHRVQERPRGVAPRGASARHVDARERRDRGEGGGAHVRGSHRRAGPLTLARDRYTRRRHLHPAQREAPGDPRR